MLRRLLSSAPSPDNSFGEGGLIRTYEYAVIVFDEVLIRFRSNDIPTKQFSLRLLYAIGVSRTSIVMPIRY